jgi:hypothetical protein
MKLPTRGFFVNDEGAVVWAWEHNDPTREFDVIAPVLMDADGNARMSVHPQGTVVDLEHEDLRPQEIAPFMHDIANARFRKGPDGRYRILMVHQTPAGPVEDIHPVVHVLNARRKVQGRALLPDTLEED